MVPRFEKHLKKYVPPEKQKAEAQVPASAHDEIRRAKMGAVAGTGPVW
jgi:hypothetical protein